MYKDYLLVLLNTANCTNKLDKFTIDLKSENLLENAKAKTRYVGPFFTH